jgi:hypothetical protein
LRKRLVKKRAHPERYERAPTRGDRRGIDRAVVRGGSARLSKESLRGEERALRRLFLRRGV